MAVLDENAYFETIKKAFEGKDDAESITAIENLYDTYSDLKKQNSEQDNWKEKYEELDKSWRIRYTHRFYNGDFGQNTVGNGLPFDPAHPVTQEASGKPDAEHIRIEDLFTDK